MKAKEFFKKIWHIQGWVGNVLTAFCLVVAAACLFGLVFGIKSCKSRDELVFSNTFLSEQTGFHNNNYRVQANAAKTVDAITIQNKREQEEVINGHYIQVDLSIVQDAESTLKKHAFDLNDFKLKDHTGVYIPLNDIGSIIGWDMINYHWDQAKNGFVISSADFTTQNAVKDYTLLRKSISPGETIELTIFFKMDSKYKVENQIMVLEVDFRLGGALNSKNRGEDIILLPRPDNFPPKDEEH